MEIAEQLRHDIVRVHRAGDFLPPETELAEKFSVNRHTVRRAIDELVHDGMVRRYRGRGSQVIPTTIDYVLHESSCFTYNLSGTGPELSTQVLAVRDIEASPALASTLCLPVASPLAELTTLRLLDDIPVCLIRHHLNRINADDLSQFDHGSLHLYLQDRHGFILRRGKTRLRSRMPDMTERNRLDIGRGVPVTEVHTLNYTRDSDILIEYSISVSRSDIFEYSVEL